MIILKHKLTGKQWTYSATVWFRKGYDINDYDVLDWYDVVELFHDKIHQISDGKMEKIDAIKIIDEQPYTPYWFTDVPRPDLAPSRLPIINPAQKAIVGINAKIKPIISKIIKNDYIKYTSITVAGGVILYFLYEYFKYKKW